MECFFSSLFGGDKRTANLKAAQKEWEQKQARENEAYRERMAALSAQAQALAPLVRRQQPQRLVQFQAEHKLDLESFSFRCERYGDFLAIFMARRDPAARLGAAERTIKAVNLTTGSPIEVEPGRDPDMGGKDHFRAVKILYGGDEAWTESLRFPDVDLRPSDRQQVGWTSQRIDGCRSWDQHGCYIGVSVDGIARCAHDDAIVFGGATAGSAVTVNVPSGKGVETYSKILEAIKAGAPDESVVSPGARGAGT